MPEYPDIELYVDALERHAVGHRLTRVRLGSPFLLRSVVPPLSCVHGRTAVATRRLGKRVCLGLDPDYWLVIHLMIAGRLQWRKPDAALPRRGGLAAFQFDNGTLLLTEAGSKRRASLHLVQGEAALDALDPGGIDFMTCGEEAFAAQLVRRNHTLKRALTDPRLISGIGNAYSDEILHRARLSPVKLSQRLSRDELVRLHEACRDVMNEWRERLGARCGSGFPGKVTAFRQDMAVHGRYGQPCPACGTAVQRIVYASNETNYCPRCQTGGRLLRDRALSQLLKKDWPRSMDELEERLGE